MEKRNDGFTQHIHLTSVSLRKWEVFNSVFIFYPSGFSLVYSSLFKLVLVHSAHFSSFYPGFSNAYRVQFLPRRTSLPVHTFIGHLHFFWNKKEAIFSSRLIDQPNELDGLGGTVSSSSCNHDTTVKFYVMWAQAQIQIIFSHTKAMSTNFTKTDQTKRQ